MANANDAKRMTKNNAKLLPTSGTKGLCQEERDGDRMAMKETEQESTTDRAAAADDDDDGGDADSPGDLQRWPVL